MLPSLLVTIAGLLPMPGCNANIILADGGIPLAAALCAPTLVVVLRYLRAGPRAAAPEVRRAEQPPFRRFPELP
jgi:hypothetical protein